MIANVDSYPATDARAREAASTIPVYGQLPFVPERASGCHIFTTDGRRILDLYGGHAVAALGYGHPRLTDAIAEQSSKLLFQSNAVALDIRASAAEKLIAVSPPNLRRVFFVNSGAEANENALRMACVATGRKKYSRSPMGFTVARPLRAPSPGIRTSGTGFPRNHWMLILFHVMTATRQER